MRVNADFERRVVVHSAQLDWVASPIEGVDRRMLDRVGDEIARATSIVRYAKNSQFSPHVHTGGEEFLVLEGVFQDEHGDFPAGSYIRNPPGSEHTPGSAPGCVIFVKLWQFDPEDRQQVRLRTDNAATVPDPDRGGVQITALYQDPRETVQIENWLPNTAVSMDVPGGAELLVLAGACTEGGDQLVTHSWLRIPQGGHLDAVAGNQGTKLWVKYGHLAHVSAPE